MSSNKTYSIEDFSWQDILTNIGPNNYCLLFKDEANFVLGWGEQSSFTFIEENHNLNDLQNYLDSNQGTDVMCMLGYDLKNELFKKSHSQNTDKVNFPGAYFFVPNVLIECVDGCYTIPSTIDTQSWQKYQKNQKFRSIELTPIQTKENYLKHVNTLLDEIQFGNIYEINYCTAFENSDCLLDPIQSFSNLIELTNAPHAVLGKVNEHHIICGSPERFIKKVNNQIISEPIKGTAKRKSDLNEDIKVREQLRNDKKELAENVMIVDLVRNDLSKIAEPNSVLVSSLNELRSFKNVHQLVSTIECSLKSKINFTDILKALFPMGSMTGAPKLSAIQLSEKHEQFKRGLYAGSIGIIRKNGNFDLNVVIRSAIYNSKTKYVLVGVGGAITILSDPNKEYDECLVKLEAVKNALCSIE